MSYIENLMQERNELDARLAKLNAFIVRKSSGDEDLKCPLRLLSEQADAMRRYLNILDERIMIAKIDGE